MLLFYRRNERLTTRTKIFANQAKVCRITTPGTVLTFDPQTGATRAGVSAVLRRFMEIAIDPLTAQG